MAVLNEISSKCMNERSSYDAFQTCTAIVRSTGLRCRKPPVRGAFVCGSHGGLHFDVRLAGERRLLEVAVNEYLEWLLSRDV